MKKIINSFLAGSKTEPYRRSFGALVSCATLAVAALTAGSAEAATWNVPGDFATIQAAIDDASVVNGDTINVAAGVYNENSAPANNAIDVTKELTILGAGSGVGTGSELVPACGAGGCNAAVQITASNVVFSGFRIDAKSGVDAGTAETYNYGLFVVGTAGDITNIAISDVAVSGANNNLELNNVNGITIDNYSCDASVRTNAGVATQCYRLVDSDNIAISNSTSVAGPWGGGASSRHMVGFQGAVSASLDNVVMLGDGSGSDNNRAQYIFAQPVGYCCDPGTQQYTYGNVTMSDSVYGIYLLDNPGSYTQAEFAVTLTQNPGTNITFTNVDVPMYRGGLGELIGLNDFVCANSIPHRVTIGTAEYYFLSNADAVAYQTANGGTVDAEVCATCGDGVVGPGEQCDDGNTDAGDCCSATCQYEAAGSACGSQSDTDCDNPNTCNATGTCLDNFEPITTECRAVDGVCDVADFCDGSGSCDPDAFVTAGTECRASDGDVNSRGFICDPAESCTGAGPDCPADVVSGSNVVCNGGSGNANGGSVCDPADYCTGVAGESCPANTNIVAANTACRASIGECDYEEKCTGVAEVPCAADGFVADDTQCYGDPYIPDPPNRVPPSQPNPCVDLECQCSSGLCVSTAYPIVIEKAKMKVAKSPTKNSGKGSFTGELTEGSTVGEFNASLEAGIVGVLIEDADSSYRTLVDFPNCTLKRSDTKPRWICFSTDGTNSKLVSVSQYGTDNVFKVKATLKKRPQSETGSGGLAGPVTVTVVTDTFYRVDQQGTIGDVNPADCQIQKDGAALRCGERSKDSITREDQ